MIEEKTNTIESNVNTDKLSVKEKILMSISFIIAIGFPIYVHFVN